MMFVLFINFKVIVLETILHNKSIKDVYINGIF